MPLSRGIVQAPRTSVRKPAGSRGSEAHRGQEFNFVIEGSITVVFDDKEIVLNQWDSIYFNPMHPHGQRCHGDKVAKFITIIAE